MVKKILKNPLYLGALGVAAYLLFFRKKARALPGVTVPDASIPYAPSPSEPPFEWKPPSFTP